MAQEERSWSRALMASTGVALDHDDRAGGPSHEWLEAGAADLARARLLQFAAHRDVGIRETIALRPDCPTGVLATLAFDDSRSVRRAVAANQRIAPAIAVELSRDRDQEVLRALARNPAVGEPVLRALAAHRRSEVRRTARRELEQRSAHAPSRPSDPQTPTSELVPPELRDRWRPPKAESSPVPAANARAYAPRPVVPPRREALPHGEVSARGGSPAPPAPPASAIPTFLPARRAPEQGGTRGRM